MSGKRAARLSPDERRAQLVAIGLDMLTDRSLDELSTDDVARRAGISRGLLFQCFDSKRDFYRAVVQRECDDFVAATEPDPSLGPVPWLRSFIAGFVRYVLEHRRVCLAWSAVPRAVTPRWRTSSTRPGPPSPGGWRRGSAGSVCRARRGWPSPPAPGRRSRRRR
ncbi:TetR/AcrR family transcriptional regulator [Streptomyces sanglieri]|uniref:TetR/AcrR family transcriptional regulator n=1 Tax=Streptomyces sanglieri TaxID=193460 RepID=A0ABW2X4S1_9ACTN